MTREPQADPNVGLPIDTRPAPDATVKNGVRVAGTGWLPCLDPACDAPSRIPKSLKKAFVGGVHYHPESDARTRPKEKPGETLAQTARRTRQSAAMERIHNRSKEFLEGLDLPKCGDHGGVTLSGEPCVREAGWGVPGEFGEGKCCDHRDEKLEEIARIKAAFLAMYENQPCSLKMACYAAGCTSVTLHRLRKQDPAFDAKVRELVKLAEEVRLEMVKDALFERAADPSVNADTARFFILQNLDAEKWKDRRSVGRTAPPPKPESPKAADPAAAAAPVEIPREDGARWAVGDQIIPFPRRASR